MSEPQRKAYPATFAEHARKCEYCWQFRPGKPATLAVLCHTGMRLWRAENDLGPEAGRG